MKVNTVGKVLSEVKRAYLAGFMDGDGAIMASIERHKEKKHGFRIRIIIKITQSSRDNVEFIRRMTKVGYIAKNRTTFDWVVKGQRESKYILENIRPFLNAKKRQAEIALKILRIKKDTSKEFINAARLADSLAAFNVRSKNRRKNFAAMVQESTSRND